MINRKPTNIQFEFSSQIEITPKPYLIIHSILVDTCSYTESGSI